MSETTQAESPGIGTLSEKSLHAALKQWIAQPGDQFEVKSGRFVIDIMRGDTLIEIQTRHLYAMKRKLRRLLPDHTIHLYHPIAKQKWIVRQTADGEPISRRKSPKKGRLHDIFNELVRIPNLLLEPNLILHVLLIEEESILRDDGQGSWRRRGWSSHDRLLLGCGRRDCSGRRPRITWRCYRPVFPNLLATEIWPRRSAARPVWPGA